jgi:hypothetical protein
MVKTAQVLSNLNENFFDFEPLVRFDFAVKKFCGASLAQSPGVLVKEDKKRDDQPVKHKGRILKRGAPFV